MHNSDLVLYKVETDWKDMTLVTKKNKLVAKRKTKFFFNWTDILVYKKLFFARWGLFL